MISQRILSALVFIPALFIVIWFGDPWLSLVVAAVALGGALEFYRLAARAQRQPLAFFGVFWALLFVINAYLNTHSELETSFTTPLLAAAAAVFSWMGLLLHSRKDNTLTNWVWTMGGIFYMGWMLSHFIPLRGLVLGREWVLLALFATFAVDTSAFLVGRALGRHALTPAISPGKTWEGAIGGLVGGLIATLVLAVILGLSLSYGHVICLGLLIAVFAQLGDLAESALKRRAGVKDAGRLIPGHGGLLDRLDSTVFTVVVVYYYVIWAIV